VASYRLSAEYQARLHLDWDTRQVRLRTDITVGNTSPEPVDRLELNTVAARLGSLEGLRVTVNGAAVRAKVIGQTIRVPLEPPLAIGAAGTVRVAFRARLRTRTDGRSYFFARLGGVAQLYRVIPWLSRAIPFGRQGHGEPFLTPTSPRAEVTLSADRRLVWATTGQRIRRSAGASTYAAADVRDLVVIASPGYRTARGRSKDGETVILAHTSTADGRRWISLARGELARYEKLSGVPYPHPVFRVAESAAGLAMEAPGLIWIPGSRRSADHPFLISHETAHQWWYGIVGNDQSTDAFADEAMADYFSRKAHLSLRHSRCRTDRLDRDIRDYSSACYFEVVYVQGARFLEGLRRDFGDGRFKRAVRTYTRSNRSGIGSNVRLLEAFRAEMGDGVLPRFHARFPSLY
jgi:aminopeptidase N